MKDLLLGLARNRLTWIVAAVLVAGGAGYYYFFMGGAAGKVTFETQAVSRGDVENAVASSGSVSPLITVTVGSEVSGKLLDVLVDFNAKVTKGQLLAQIDPSTFKSRVQSAEADLVVQQATVGSREVEVDNAKVVQAQAQRDFDRAMSLYEKGLVSENDQEKARNSLEQATNSLKIAQADLNNARSQLIKVRASLDQVRIELGRTEIRSPVDGVVIARKVDPGQTVAASMQAPELFQIARDLSIIRIETKVDEADIGSIKENARATFTVDAYPDRTFEGKVAQVRINGASMQNVVTYSVMVQADNPEQMLLPGMTANVKVITDERRNVLRVASSALRFRPPNAAAAPGADLGGAGGNRAQGGGPGGGPPGGGFGGGPPGGGPPGGGFPGGGGGGNSGGQRAGGPRGGGMVQMTPEVMQSLGLDAKQQAAVTAAIQEVRDRIRAEAQGSSSSPLGGGVSLGRGGFGGGNNAGQLMQQRIRNALSNILTEEQMQKYTAMAQGRGQRPGTVYVLNAKGEPESKTVIIGLADDSNTEVVSGLKEGDLVVVRSRTEQR
jgi:HlyD family secretion protein